MRVFKVTDLSYEKLRGVEKVAILLNSLGSQAVKPLLGQLDDASIRKIITLMPKFRIVPVDITKKVLEEFYEILNESQDFIFSAKTSAKETLAAALGEERARAILGGLTIQAMSARQLESLELVDSKSLANFISREHPQIIAVILAYLEPEKRSEVLKRLNPALQVEVIYRLARLENVDPDVLKEMNEILKKELASFVNTDQSAIGGIQPVAETINLLDKDSETRLLNQLEQKDPLLAAEIRKLMFTFEDLMKVDDENLRILLTALEKEPEGREKLIKALKTASETIRNRIFKVLPNRQVEILKEELEIRRVRISESEQAQSEIISLAKRLESENKLFLNRGGDDVMV